MHLVMSIATKSFGEVVALTIQMKILVNVTCRVFAFVFLQWLVKILE